MPVIFQPRRHGGCAVLEGSGGGRAENGKSHKQCLQQRVEAAVAGRKTRKPANNAYNERS
jgi:hypothetical protein